VRAVLDKELALIEELGYESYFLTVHDIVAFARSQRILCQGRGSAANSVVCFVLGITELDPMSTACCSSASCRASATSRRTSTWTSSTTGAKK
jgi:DNA polymerase III alpha subunit